MALFSHTERCMWWWRLLKNVSKFEVKQNEFIEFTAIYKHIADEARRCPGFSIRYWINTKLKATLKDLLGSPAVSYDIIAIHSGNYTASDGTHACMTARAENIASTVKCMRSAEKLKAALPRGHKKSAGVEMLISPSGVEAGRGRLRRVVQWCFLGKSRDFQ